MVERFGYDVDGWGRGELVLTGALVAWHELPRPRPKQPGGGAKGDLDVPLVYRLQAYFRGARDSFVDVEVELDWCTPFQRAVVDAIRSIAYGEVATYGEVAALAGYPNAQRAVGSVCASNRFGLFVPCHRVVAAADLGSYGELGPAYKRRLLELEHVAL